jgi:hypothetical protein
LLNRFEVINARRQKDKRAQKRPMIATHDRSLFLTTP